MSEVPRSSGLDDTIVASEAPDAQATSPHEAPASEQRYQLGAELGRGGMGRVVEAFDTRLGRTVALKEMLTPHGDSLAKRFQREVRITARLEHASIVPLYDAGVMPDGRPYYVMRRVSGQPLHQLIARAHRLDERLALLPDVLAAIDAIAHAHRRGVIHRDIKPQNILVGELGETVVIDWGLAKVIGEDEASPASLEPRVPSAADSLKTHAGAVFGTPGFMAPEQARGDELGPGSDVYALGATLYQLVAGQPPVRGTSATEVIERAMKNEIVPLREVAPNAPAELVTIVAKALAPDPAQRYPDAGALAEDVRRFLTGQLVAAHRYTPRQRLVRFARRHRAALSVAVLALTALAVLAWVSVRRIVKERDAATAARADAEYQRTVADHKAAEARQRADQLLLAHARGLVERNPTHAIATLASSPPNMLDEARAVAKAAVARGVAWGLPSLPGPTTSFEMTRDGSRLLQMNREGTLQVLDLDRRRQLVSLSIGTGASATWVGEDQRILVTLPAAPPTLYDPTTRDMHPIAAAPATRIASTPDGKLVAYIDSHRDVGVIDIDARTATPVWTKGTAVDAVAIAPDGSWIAFGERVDAKRGRLVIVDRAGKLLATHAGRPLVLGASQDGKLAATFYDEVIELRPGGPSTKLPLDPSEVRFIHQLVYRGEVLELVGARNVLSFAGGRIARGDPLANTLYLAQVAAGALVVTANDNNVHLVRGGAHLVLQLGSSPEGMYRAAAGRDTTRVAATAKDAILVWDTASLFPQVLDTPPGPFVSSRRMVVPAGPVSEWYVYDVATGTRTPVQRTVDGFPVGFQAVPDEDRLLALVQTGRGTSAIVIRSDGSSEIAVDDLADGHAVGVPGNAIVYSRGKSRVFGKVAGEDARELAVLDGEVRSLASNGPLGYVALGARGELVRGTFGGDFARTHVPDLEPSAFVVADPARNAIVASGHRLLRWRGDVHELARFAAAIDRVVSTDAGLFVELANRDVFFVPASGNQTPRRVPITQLGSISRRGHVVAGITPNHQIELVDIPSLAKWTLPELHTSQSRVALAPDGLLVLRGTAIQVAVWRLPQPGSDLAAWLAELTNATERDGALRWPWQP